MLRRATRSCSSRSRVCAAIGIPWLLLSAPPAVAANAAGVGIGIGATTTALKLLASFWALLAVRGAFSGVGGAAAAASMAVIAFVSWPAFRRAGAGTWHLRLSRAPTGSGVRIEKSLPPCIDAANVLADARSGFMRLQAAWDARDLETLEALTLPCVFDDLRDVMAAIESPSHRTEVLTLDAKLLALEKAEDAWLASVEFSGLMRESADGDAAPFRELWMLAAEPDVDPQWRLARQQALL